MQTHDWVIKRSKRNDSRSLLPFRFPYLIDNNTGIVCEPALVFLFDTYVLENPNKEVPATLLSYAFDLKQWFCFLEEFGLIWTAAKIHHFTAFAKVMRATISPQTGRAYATTSINRHRTTIKSFYKWGKSRNIAAADTSADCLLHCKLDEIKSLRSLKKGANEKQHVSVMMREQAKLIVNAVGPLPSQLQATPRPESVFNSNCLLSEARSQRKENGSTIRLAVEIALNTGLRISEVRSLTESQFRLNDQVLSDTYLYAISVIGKGRKRRTVDFPGWLIREINAHVGMKCNKNDSLEESFSKILQNNRKSKMSSSGAISTRTIQRQFANACIQANQYQMEEISTFEDAPGGLLGGTSKRRSPNFCFHDLRHTYAVWTYYARKRAGDNEPWLYIQKQLGHADLITTIETYLSSTREFEATITDSYMKRLYEESKNYSL